jgi:hypothetical protein
MKKKYKSVLIYSLLFLTTITSFAQADVNTKRILAFEAFENGEYEIVTSIIQEIKPQFRSYPLNLLGIEILSAYQIILKDPTKDFDFLDQTRNSITQYLEDKKAEEDNYFQQVLRAKYKLDTYPTDRETFLAQVEEIKMREEAQKLQEERERKELQEREEIAREERRIQLEIDKQRIEKEKIEAEIKRREQEVLNEKRRLENEKIAEENRILRQKEREKQEKLNARNARKHRFKTQKFSNLGFVAGEIATYGLLFETGGGNNFLGFRVAIRSSLTPEEDILNGTVTVNKNEFDIGPTFKITNWLFLNIGGGYGYYNYRVPQDFFVSESLETQEYYTANAGLMIRLTRIISISGGASFMDIDKESFIPEYTVGISFNLRGKG